tara:strand:- start:17520 stop:18185 length:666 start_codon:yes stop_codon:yes gene_type:complete
MINKKSLAATSVAAFAAAGGAHVQAIPMQWAAADGGNDHWYELDRQNLSWTGARQNALDKGGYLATITSAEENSAVNLLITLIEGSLLDGNLDIAVWLGGSDTAEEGIWTWADGPEAGDQFWDGDKEGTAPAGAYANWVLAEPNNFDPGEDHLGMYFLGGVWNDFGDLPSGGLSGTPGFFSVIEYDSEPVPASAIPVTGTAALTLLGLAGLAAGRRRKKAA